MLTRSNKTELEFRFGRAYRAEKLAHPTRFERVTFAFGAQRSRYAAIHLDPADRGEKWRRSAPFAGRRPIMPADVRGEQSDVLEAVLPGLRHPALRARIADVVWSGDAVARVLACFDPGLI